MTDDIQYSEEASENKCCQEWELGSGSFSTPLMTRNQDISFGAASPVICDVESPAYTCRSSFSSFMAEPSTPCLASAGFSFRSDDDSDALVFASPVTSMPSFAFFSPVSVEQGSCTTHGGNEVSNHSIICMVLADNSSEIISPVYNAESSLHNLLIVTDSSPCFGPELKETEHKAAETKRAGGTFGSKMLGIHNKRNRTIGLGEREQLDFMVSESVIRWASCTHLPTAPSLRSSLVC